MSERDYTLLGLWLATLVGGYIYLNSRLERLYMGKALFVHAGVATIENGDETVYVPIYRRIKN